MCEGEYESLGLNEGLKYRAEEKESPGESSDESHIINKVPISTERH
jgi:hypothetical protein